MRIKTNKKVVIASKNVTFPGDFFFLFAPRNVNKSIPNQQSGKKKEPKSNSFHFLFKHKKKASYFNTNQLFFWSLRKKTKRNVYHKNQKQLRTKTNNA